MIRKKLSKKTLWGNGKDNENKVKKHWFVRMLFPAQRKVGCVYYYACMYIYLYSIGKTDR